MKPYNRNLILLTFNPRSLALNKIISNRCHLVIFGVWLPFSFLVFCER